MSARPHRVVTAALTCALLAGCGTGATAAPAPARSSSPPAPVVTSRPPAAVRPSAPAQLTYPAHGLGRWTVVPAGSTAPAGNAGRLMRYRVAVERDIAGLLPAAFARAAENTLADPRGWTAGGRWRFQRVGPGQRADFTLYLATPDTRDRLCSDVPDGYTSCRNGDRVVLNVARWAKGVPDYGANLAAYRTYLLNHEIGHRLGHGHQRCPHRGDPAPVMLQQTLGLHGCTANAWPYPDGDYYAGPSGQYADEPPGRDRGTAP